MFIVLRQLETALRAMKNYIDNIIPRKVSDLQNDAEYITENDVPTDVSGFTNDVGYITSADIPTPDWTATSLEPGYIDNKPNILPGTGQMSIQTNAGHTVTGTQSASFGAQNNVSGNLSFSVGVENNVSGGEAFAAGNYNIANHESQFVFGQFNAADPSNAEATQRGTYIEIVGNGDGTTASGEIDRSNARTLDWEGNQWIAGNMKVGGTGYDDSNAVEVATKNDIPTPDWEAISTDDGYIANKPDLMSGSGIGSVQNSQTTASGYYSHAEGNSTTASMGSSHAEGTLTTASAPSAHAEGNSTTASGHNAHAEGAGSVASGSNSHAEGWKTIAKHLNQHVGGAFNIPDPSTARTSSAGTYIEIIGNGTADNARSNARTLDWSGNEWLAGNLKVGGTGYTDSNAKEIATKDYVDTAITDIDVSGSKIIPGTWTTPQSGQPYLDYDDSSMTDETLIGLLNNDEFVTLKVNFPDILNGQQTDTRYYHLKSKSVGEENNATSEFYLFYSMPSPVSTIESGYNAVMSVIMLLYSYDSSGHGFMWFYHEMPLPVKDVTINGTSIVGNDGIAEIPVASANDLGVVKIGDVSSGIILLNKTLMVACATAANIKQGTSSNRPIAPLRQHESAFYGLAKAAGDTTQSASSNAVGTYTDNAKASIKAMLGVGGETQKVTVSGTAPVIVANQNTRYVCGEVVSLDFTPSAEGICDVIFTSGSTVTVLTLPSTVRMPEWWEGPEAGYTYEINVVDGIYGVVTSWVV